MTKRIEDSLNKIPILNWLVRLGKQVKIPGLQGMSLYDVIEMYVLGIVKGALTSRAGGIAFSFFMALFPFILFILTLIPYIPIEGFQEDFLVMIEQLLPPNTAETVHDVIEDIANTRYSGLLSFGFIASVFLMTNGVNAILGGFEYSYHVTEMRSIIRQYFISMIMSIMLSLILVATVAIILYFEIGINDLKSKGWLEDDVFWIEKGQFLFFVLLVFFSVSLLYKYGTKEVKYLSFITPGSILTTLLTIVMFKLFSIYVVKFATYNQLYGSIGTLLVLMLFVWLNAIILLLGFELNASISRLRRFHIKE
ncbi:MULTISPECIES: YihY/virulence factor BrkB family protein [Flavobacteriaceae]|uniref:YihY/virulence factor BrkB family protein n=2 Tax=Flavobacteriaceae TaxID=49546 RepID=A0A4Y8AXW1_9FLAO|nr:MULTISPECIES: YihY/virulence factor BrkB family protein [Flavobacteriaceae]TEW76925.1 YihY/virulence factor BrkB family protein [Gramella jeungdoensis]